MLRQIWILGCMCVLALSSALPAAAQNQTAQLRVLHTAQEVQAVDVFVDNKAVDTNLSFPNASDYLDVQSGQRQFALAPSGASSAEAILTSDIALETGQAYTVAAVYNTSLESRLFSDDLSATPAGKARVRFIHTSPDAPSVDVEAVGGPTLFEGVGFGQAGSYQLLDAGSYNLRAVSSGQNVVVLQLPNVQFKAGYVYDIVAAGRLAALKTQVLQSPALPASSAPQHMPQTGVGDTLGTPFLMLLAALLLAGGFATRRKAVRL